LGSHSFADIKNGKCFDAVHLRCMAHECVVHILFQCPPHTLLVGLSLDQGLALLEFEHESSKGNLAQQGPDCPNLN